MSGGSRISIWRDVVVEGRLAFLANSAGEVGLKKHTHTQAPANVRLASNSGQLFKRFYLFMRHRERQRHRQREK